MPKVTVLIPLYNGSAFIEKSLQSVLTQTFTDWEVIVVNEYESNDGGAEIVLSYGKKDPRFKLIQNEKRLGLAESLNAGMKAAKGEYIARLDADDTALPERFEKQVAFMDSHPDVGVCGTWQLHYGSGNEWVHTAEPNPDKLRCMLLFWCDLCHSTLMLRRTAFLEHSLFYDPNALAEDFELWSRAMQYMQIANLPEVLGTYNESTGITPGKKDRLNKESGMIAARTLERILGLKLRENEKHLLNSWINPLEDSDHRDDELRLLRDILSEIWINNQRVGFFDSDYLLQILAAKWFWTKDYLDWKTDYSHIHSLSQVFSDEYRPGLISRYTIFRAQNPNIKTRIKKITKKLLRPMACASRRVTRALMKDVYQQIDSSIERWTWDRYDRLNRDIEAWTWDRYDRLNRDVEAWTWDRYDRLSHDVEAWTWNRYKRLNRDIERWTWDRFKRTNKAIEKWTWDRYKRERQDLLQTTVTQRHFRPHKTGTPIRIGILFQIPSCWPSLESVWEALQYDERFNAKMYLYDAEQREAAQMAGAREFLEKRNILFTTVERYTFAEEKLDVLIYQTPWDDAHRPDWLKSDMIQHLGTRIAYIPYGLHYMASVWKDFIFSEQKFRDIPWRIFLATEHLRYDLNCQTKIPLSVVEALGHPKFDSIAHKSSYPLEPEVSNLIGERKIVFIQMHFPQKEGNPSFPVPSIEEYTDFLRHADEYKNFFFLVRPHPKMYDEYLALDMEQALEAFDEVIVGKENVFNYQFPDYRPALYAADYIVGDRSALLVEAGALNVPVLYMTNYYYKEKMLPYVEPLFDSYYQGSLAFDICHFMDMVAIKGNDYKKEMRDAAARLCLPEVDGHSGKRIVNAIAQAVYNEEDPNA